MSRQLPSTAHNNHKNLSSAKLKQLTELFLKRSTLEAKPHLAIDLSALAAQLFARSTEEFLENNTLEHLVHITEHAAQALVEFANGKQQPVIMRHYPEPTHIGLHIILNDRPFIINTITETVRERAGDIRVFLHPILKDNQTAISCCYLEIAHLAEEQLRALQESIDAALQQLVIVNDDFPAMILRLESLAHRYEKLSPTAAVDSREIAEFLHLLIDGGFIFLGHAEWHSSGLTPSPVPTTTLGACKGSTSSASAVLAELCTDAQRLQQQEQAVALSRLNTKSSVQRRVRPLNISIKEFAANGTVGAIHSFMGLLTSKTHAQESSSVPLIRRKLARLLDLEGAIPNSYDYKAIINLIDYMPTEDALRLDIEVLQQLAQKALNIHSHHGTKVALLSDTAVRGLSVLIIMPRDRFNNETRHALQNYIETIFNAPIGSSEYLLDLSDTIFARVYFSIAVTPSKLAEVNVAHLESEIAAMTKSWRDALDERLGHSALLAHDSTLSAKYSDAFGEDYQAVQNAADAEADIYEIERISEVEPLRVRLAVAGEKLASIPDQATIIVYQRALELPLSKALPILEYSGFEVLSERANTCTPRDGSKVYLHRFIVRPRCSSALSESNFSRVVAPGLTRILRGLEPSDPLNYLLLTPGLDSRAISLLRTYAGLLSQINKFATRHAIFYTLCGVPTAATKLWQIFEAKFDPSSGIALESRLTRVALLLEEYRDILTTVGDISQDRILRGLGQLLEYTIRTNFYTGNTIVAIKIHSERAEFMPQPRPKYEIFISAPTVEGIHLRSAMVARGGLRWSERKDDYRTEVLGLMKTQKIKNVVIVPSGAKGGFIVKQMPDDPTKIKATVENAYRDFIRGLLSLTDNIVAGKVVHPSNLVVYDGEDPYFVVAADKGTASFSDIANTVAVEEFNFWLGDAFASGGSYGYDHKKSGITARGVWECVKRHFRELGIDHENTPFTAIGIGDMSGDVFGNGLLLSDQVKLIAAFDHRSIFIDPSPDPTTSFAERKRLFNLKGSHWEDYQASLLSRGGGVWSRLQKEITLAPEARCALSLAEDAPQTMNGEQLITYILCARVDLLWNGGIGTYVKSRLESSADVSDTANDRVRINADELRCRVVGEGGNLGFTQRARCEYAHLGGHINTDAIDNSGGVDLSDHEVNLKILFASLMADGSVTFDERNRLIREMSEEVISTVLAHNRSHALAISLAAARSQKNIHHIRSFLKEMQKQGYINRQLDSLPDDEELEERVKQGQGVTRPEIAILLATVKMWTKEVLIASPLIDDALLDSTLMGYFPALLRTRFSKAIHSHSLGRHIIASQVTNTIVDAVGVSFFHRVMNTFGANGATVVKATIAADTILGMPRVRAIVQCFDSSAKNDTFMAIHHDLTRTLRAAAGWIVGTHADDLQLSDMVKLYSDSYRSIAMRASEVLGREERATYETGLARYNALGIEDASARMLASFPLVITILEMLATSRLSNKEVMPVAKVYAQMLETLRIHKFVTLGQTVKASNRWDNELRINSYEEIRRGLSTIACTLLARSVFDKAQVHQTLRSSSSFEQLGSMLNELGTTTPSAAALSVIARQIRMYKL